MTDVGVETGKQIYENYRQKQIQINQNEINESNQIIKSTKTTIDFLSNVHHKIRQKMMIPFGKVAYMEGHLVHTNEALVLLGGEYFVKCSTNHATQIIQRRLNGFENHLEKLEEQLQLVNSNMELSKQLENQDFLEIIEHEDDLVPGTQNITFSHSQIPSYEVKLGDSLISPGNINRKVRKHVTFNTDIVERITDDKTEERIARPKSLFSRMRNKE